MNIKLGLGQKWIRAKSEKSDTQSHGCSFSDDRGQRWEKSLLPSILGQPPGPPARLINKNKGVYDE
jgi:hypothetical protein